MERLGGPRSEVVMPPSPIQAIQLVNELFLWSMSVSVNHHFHISRVTFDRLFTGSDDCFETERFSSRVLSRMGFAHGELSDGPSEKIVAHLLLVFLKRVGYPGF